MKGEQFLGELQSFLILVVMRIKASIIDEIK